MNISIVSCMIMESEGISMPKWAITGMAGKSIKFNRKVTINGFFIISSDFPTKKATTQIDAFMAPFRLRGFKDL